MKRKMIGLALLLASFACGMSNLPAQAEGAVVIAPLGNPAEIIADKGIKSLVLVEFTLRNDNNSMEEVGQGIVLSNDGVVLIPGSLIPESLPKEWIKDLKIRVLNKKYNTVPAKFLGRTTNRLFAYIKADLGKDATTAPATNKSASVLDTPPLDLSEVGEVGLGAEVIAVARYDKVGGYEPYLGFSRVRAVIRLTHDVMMGQSFSYTRANSPVYDLATGKLVGITLPPIAETMLMSGGKAQSSRIMLKDDEQSSVFLPWSEIKDAVTNVPHEAFDSRRPWIGIGEETTGLNEDLRTMSNIDQLSGLTVGSVIPGMPADVAGIKSRDIILTIDGAPFSNSPVPEIMVSHFQKAIEKTKIGQEITLGVMRDGAKLEIKVKVGETPRLSSEMPLFAHPKIGVTTRDLVFNDAYIRKLPADQKGVMVVVVKQGSAASLGQTPLKSGYLITRVNDQDVSDQKQFDELLKTALASADTKEVVFRIIRQDGETQVCRIDLSK